MQKEENKFLDTDVFEGMPSISAVIKSIESGISDRRIITVYIDQQKIRSKAKEIGFIKFKASSLHFDIEFVNNSIIDSMTVGNTHGGIVAVCSERTIPTLSDACIKQNGIYYMLDGIEVRLGVDYLENKEELDELADKVIYTGAIDAYFDYK